MPTRQGVERIAGRVETWLAKEDQGPDFRLHEQTSPGGHPLGGWLRHRGWVDPWTSVVRRPSDDENQCPVEAWAVDSELEAQLSIESYGQGVRPTAI